MHTWSQMNQQSNLSSLTQPILPSKFTKPSVLTALSMDDILTNNRVTPELKSQISAGKINLSAIVNTHQYAPLT